MASKWKDLYDIGYEYKDIRRIRANIRKLSGRDYSGYRASQKGVYSKFISDEDALIDYVVNRQQETGETLNQILSSYDKNVNEFIDDEYTPEEMQQFKMYVEDINALYGSEQVTMNDFMKFDSPIDNEYIIQIMNAASKYKNYNDVRAQEYLDCLLYYLETGIKTLPPGAPAPMYGEVDEV